MSRFYEMAVQIEGYDPKRSHEIKVAADEEWEFYDDWNEFGFPPEIPKYLCASGRGSLYGGETEDEFAKKLTKAIFIANKAPCKVAVKATCLENLPHETYEFGPDDYQHLVLDDQEDAGEQ